MLWILRIAVNFNKREVGDDICKEMSIYMCVRARCVKDVKLAYNNKKKLTKI